MRGVRRLNLVAAVCAALAAPLPAAADDASERLVRDFVSKLDATLAFDARAAKVESEGADTVISGLSIILSDSGVRFGADAIRLSDLKPVEGGGFSASGFEITGGVAGSPALTYAAPRISARDFSTPGFGTWRFDDARPFEALGTLVSRLSASEMEGIDVPASELTIAFGAGGDGRPAFATLTLANLRFGAMKQGNLASLALDKVEAALVGGGNPTTMRSTGLSLTGLDVGALGSVLDPFYYAGKPGDRQWRPVIGGLEIGGLTFSQRDKRMFTLGGIALAELAARQMDEAPSVAFDELIRSLASGAGPAMAMLTGARGRSLTGWLKLDRLTIEDAAFTPGNGTASLTRANLEGLSPDGLVTIAVDGLVFAPPSDFTLEWRKASLSKVAWPEQDALARLLLMVSGLVDLASLTPEERGLYDAAFLAVLPQIGEAVLEGFKLRSGSDALTLDSFSLSASGPYVGPIAGSLAVSLKGLDISAGIVSGIREISGVMEALGRSSLVLDAEYSGTLSEGTLNRDLELRLRDLATVEAEIGLSGVTSGMLNRLGQFIRENTFARVDLESGSEARLLVGLGLAHAKLRYEESGLLAQLLEAEAKKRLLDVETVRGNLRADFIQAVADLGLRVHGEPIVAAFGAFLNQPDSLTFSVSPDAPVPIALLVSLRENATDLALSVLNAKLSSND